MYEEMEFWSQLEAWVDSSGRLLYCFMVLDEKHECLLYLLLFFLLTQSYAKHLTALKG